MGQRTKDKGQGTKEPESNRTRALQQRRSTVQVDQAEQARPGRAYKRVKATRPGGADSWTVSQPGSSGRPDSQPSIRPPRTAGTDRTGGWNRCPVVCALCPVPCALCPMPCALRPVSYAQCPVSCVLCHCLYVCLSIIISEEKMWSCSGNLTFVSHLSGECLDHLVHTGCLSFLAYQYLSKLIQTDAPIIRQIEKLITMKHYPKTVLLRTTICFCSK